MNRPERDPWLNLRFSDDCWNSNHAHWEKGDFGKELAGCTGWCELTPLQESVKRNGGGEVSADRCECPCHDDREKPKKRVKPVSMELPDVGTIEV